MRSDATVYSDADYYCTRVGGREHVYIQAIYEEKFAKEKCIERSYRNYIFCRRCGDIKILD